MAEKIRLALLGQPNSGKSSLFNALTGAHQHVGNWPGKTVECKTGSFVYNSVSYEITDLPGSYSLSANSDEETVTRDFAASGEADISLILVDASQLERSMFMLADYAGISTPAVLVLTMSDVAKDQGKEINEKKLSEKLGIPVVSVVAPDKRSFSDFYNTLDAAVKQPKRLDVSGLYKLMKSGGSGADFKKALSLVPAGGINNMSAEWLACKLLEGDSSVIARTSVKGNREKIAAFCGSISDGALYTSECKFAYIEALIADCVRKTKKNSELLTRFDKIAISRRWGKLVSLGIIIVGLVATMICAAPLMGLASVVPKLLSSFFSSSLGSVGVSAGIINFINATLVTSLG